MGALNIGSTLPDILWLGWSPSPGRATGDVSSAASNRWQRNFLGALEAHARIVRIGHRAQQSWPKGPILGQAGKWTGERANHAGPLSRYINIKGMRVGGLSAAYLRAAESMYLAPSTPQFIITYNMYPYTAFAANRCRGRWEVPWINVRADPVPLDQVRGYGPDATIYLSRRSYERHARAGGAYHLPGGVHNPAPVPRHIGVPHEGHLVVYAGAMTGHAGVPLLLRAMEYATSTSLRLVLCGGRPTKDMEAASKRDSRVSFAGFLPEEDLNRLASRACVFVNPRPSHVAATAEDFPSKLLWYLEYPRPILSTVTAGLHGSLLGVLETIPSDPKKLGGALDSLVGRCGSEAAAAQAEVVARYARDSSWEGIVGACYKWMVREHDGISGGRA